MRFILPTLRVIILFALAVCGALLNDYLFPIGALCGFESGCAEVITSAYGRPLGVPLPVVGLAGFGLVYGLSLFPEGRAFALLRPLLWLAGLAGIGLILVQFLVLHQTCPLCLLVDGSAVALAVVGSVGGLRRGALRAPSWLGRLAWVWVALLAVATPPLGAWLRAQQPVPEVVRNEWVEGKINVVEVTDFDCPRCQEAEPVLQEFRRKLGDWGHFTRLVVELPMHATARSAGRAYLAAVAQGKGEEMAAALFDAPNRDAPTCRRLAREIGLNLAEYEKVVRDRATDAKIDANTAWAQHLSGVPVVWVQDQLIPGMPTLDRLESALHRVERAKANGR